MIAYKLVRDRACVQMIHRSYLLDLLIRLTLCFLLGPITRVLEAALQSLSNGPVHFILTKNFELLSSLASM